MIELNSLSSFFYDFVTENGDNNENFYFDLHMHTPASDGNITGKFLNRFLSGKKYLISVTDHNSIKGNIKLRKMGLNVVPGFELGCNDGFEILVYFKTEHDLIDFYLKEVYPYKNKYRMTKTSRSVFEYIKILRENYTVHISIPHINGYAQKNYLKNKDYIDEVLRLVDAIEIYNHSLSSNKNNEALKLKNEYRLYSTFGSDAHDEREILSYYRVLNKEIKKVKNFVDKVYKIKTVTGIGKKHFLNLFKNKISY